MPLGVPIPATGDRREALSKRIRGRHGPVRRVGVAEVKEPGQPGVSSKAAQTRRQTPSHNKSTPNNDPGGGGFLLCFRASRSTAPGTPLKPQDVVVDVAAATPQARSRPRRALLDELQRRAVHRGQARPRAAFHPIEAAGACTSP